MKKYYVYKITNEVTGWVYVGTTINLIGRWKTHESRMRLGNHNTVRMTDDYREHGSRSFIYEVVAEFPTKKEMLDYEFALISQVSKSGKCYNLHGNPDKNFKQQNEKEYWKRRSEKREYDPSLWEWAFEKILKG